MSGSPSMSTARVERRNPIIAAASAMPSTTPRTEPARPRASAWRPKMPSTWRAVVPAARRRPTSRVRSVRVMTMVLATRKPPTASATRPNRNAMPAKPFWARASWEAASATVSTTNGSWSEMSSSRCMSDREVSGMTRSTEVTGAPPVVAPEPANAVARVLRGRTATAPEPSAPKPTSSSRPTICMCGGPLRRSPVSRSASPTFRP